MLALLAVVWLGYQGWRLLFQPRPHGAIDLRLRHLEVTSWIAGEPVYAKLHNAMYPPASYVMMTPLGWMEFPAARWLWAALTVACLAVLARLLHRHGGGRSRSERRLLALLPFGTYPVGAATGNGQLGIIVITCLFSALLLLRTPRSLRRDLAVAGLTTLALIKPTLAAPFFWMLLWIGGLRPAALCVFGYLALTVAGAQFQSKGTVKLLRAWHHRSVVGANYGASRGEGAIRVKGRAPVRPEDWAGDRKKRKKQPGQKQQGVKKPTRLPREEVKQNPGGRSAPAKKKPNGLRIRTVTLHSLLAALELTAYASLATVGTLAMLGLWLGLRRRGPPWVLAGATAIVAREYAYLAWYDDVLLLIPLVALLRLSGGVDPCTPRVRRIAGALFVLNLVAVLAPGGIYSLPRVLANAYAITHTMLLLAALVLFIAASRATDNSEVTARA